MPTNYRNPISDGGPAFPRHYGTSFSAERETSNWHGGMSLRDWFAGQALNGIMADQRMAQLGKPLGGEPVSEWVAVSCYELADAMLQERQR